MPRKTKLDILKEKYTGIVFRKNCISKSNKVSWSWKGKSGTCISYKDIEWHIRYTIETHNRLFPNKKISLPPK